MVTETLEQRGKIYGRYEEGLAARAMIINILESHHINVSGEKMPGATRVAFSDLVMKLVRAAGNPSHTDSFHDLAGYSTLIEEMINDTSSN